MLAGAADWLAPMACATERRWTGSANAFWSEPTNWDPAGPPQNGDILLFRKDDSNRSMNNDLVGLRVSILSFGFEGNDSSYVLSGNSLTVGTLAVYPDGSASVTINCPLSFTSSGRIYVDNAHVALIFESTTDLYLNGPIDLNGGLELEAFESSVGAGHVSRIHIPGPISGSGNLRMGVFIGSDGSQGGSYVEFTGSEPNTFGGTLSVHGTAFNPSDLFASRIYFSKPTGVAVVNDGARLVIEQNAVVHFRSSEQIGDNADVEVRSGGALRLENAIEGIRNLILTDNNRFGNFNQFIDLRSPTVDTGTRLLALNGGLICSKNPTNSSDVPSIRGTLNLNGFLPIEITRDFGPGLDIFATVTGGGFSKTGSGSLRLHAANTFTDDVVVNEGIVEARNNLALGTSAGGVQLAGGGLNLRDVTILNEALLGADSSSSLVAFGNCIWTGPITLNEQLTIFADNLRLEGAISGPGDLVLLGTEIELFGSQPNTFTGATVANCDLLRLNKAPIGTVAFNGPLFIGQDSFTPKEVRWLNHAQVGGVDTAVTLGPNALMNLNGHHELIGSLTFRGGSVQNSGTATLGLLQTITARVATATATINGGRLAIALGQRNFHVEDGAPGPDLSITATIVDAGGITKSGPGTLLLNAPNSFAGLVEINAGLVHIQNNTSLGTTGVGTTVVDGATLQVEFVGALAEPLNIRGAGHGGTLGALNLMAATGVGVNVVMAGPSTVRVDDQFAILGGALSGTGPFTKVGAGTLQFGGGGGPANTYTGDTFVEEGILVTSKATGVTTIPGHLIIGGGGGLFGASATVRHFNGFTIGGGVTLNRGGVWDLNGNSESFSVAGLQGRPALTLNVGSDVQTGAGTLFLPGDSDVVVNPGTFPGASSLISGNLALDPGPHRFIVQRGVSGIGIGGLELDVSAVISQTSSAAEIVKQGPGVMRLGGANSFTGPVTVNAGELTVANDLALGTAAGGTFVNDNASLALDGGIEVEAETLTLDSTNAAALLSLGPVTNTWSGNIVLQRTAGIRVPDARGAFTHFGGTTTFDISAISGPGGFTKSGPGVLFITGLQGANSFTGPTTVIDGSLEALRRGSLSGNIVVSGANATLRTARATGVFPARTVLPFGTSMTVQDGALWAMNGTNSETISRLEGNGRLEIGTGGALTVTNIESCTFSGPLSGSGALNKRGAATLRLTADSAFYSGLATVFEGTYKVDGRIPNSPITVKSSATLRGGFAGGDVTVEAGGLVEPDPVFPGKTEGVLFMASANFQAGASLGATFFGPDPTGGNDHLEVANAVTLNNTHLNAEFAYAPREGDIITLINKSGAGAINGTFNGLPEGALQVIDEIPVVMSYVGGNGNEATLTVTNLPLRSGGAQVVSGNGGSGLVPNDCSQLWLAVTNRSAVALTGLRGMLRSLTEGVVVTTAESAYPDLAPSARGTNAQPFQIRTEPSFPCGGRVQFELVLAVSNFPPTAIVYTMLGTLGSALSFDGRDDYVRLATNAFAAVSNNFTIELWANPTGSRTETVETNFGVSGVSVPLRQLQRFAVFPDRGDLSYGANHVGAGLSIGNNGISAYEYAANFLPSRLVYSNALSGWTHVALVYVNRRPRLYVNGVLVRSSPTATASFIHASANLGGSIHGDFGDFRGQLDEVRIWNIALSETQIQANMSHSLTGAESGLVTYFRCDEGEGSTLADSAPASPNRDGTLTDGTAFVFPGVLLMGVPGVADCNSGRGACESCIVVNGQFTSNAPQSARRLPAGGLRSVCDLPKPCPGFEEFTNSPVRHVLHYFTNRTAAELCVTAQMRIGCSNPPAHTFSAAAYAGEFFIDQPCANYLGDDGAYGAFPPPFSFRVPPLATFVIVATARTPDPVCDNYTLELFGLPCPPPALSIAKDSDKVLLQWSSAYPDFHLQSANAIDSVFSNVLAPRVLAAGKFGVTNAISGPREFFRLLKP